MKREAGDYIEDIIDAMIRSMNFIEGMDYEDFIGFPFARSIFN